jgi:hypothetical protein
MSVLPSRQSLFIRQCAWCWCLMDGLGNYTIEVGHNLAAVPRLAEHVSHTICASCELQFEKEAGLA